MPFLDSVNRAPKTEVLPDKRLRVTRRWDIVDFQATVRTEDQFSAKVLEDWGTPDVDYPDCRLVSQNQTGAIDNPNKSPNDPAPYLIRVYEQIPENDRVIVGLPAISYDQYGFKNVVINYIQMSAGTTPYADVVGTSTAPSPNEMAVLKTIEGENNGTVRTYKLTYITGGEMGDHSEIRFSGKVIVRTLKYLNMIPPTPSGYVLVGPGAEYVTTGLPLYEYQFVAATGGTRGSGTYIGQDTQYAQSPDQGTTGVTIVTITAVVPQGDANPVVSPGAGYQLIDVKYSDEAGYRMFTVAYAKGQGVIESTINYSNKGLLVIYSITSINVAPTAPSPTIGGTVVLIDSNTENGQRTHDGTIIYRYKWAEGKGVISTDSSGEGDGAIIQTIGQLDANAATPTTPGAGWYLVNLQQQAADGHYVNRAVYKKPPATVTLNQTTQFEKPGFAVFTGSPPQLVLTPPVTLTIIGNMEVSYDVTQISDVPFSVTGPASFYENYTPTATGVPVTNTVSLGRYLAGASGISGSASVYNGILCDTWSATLVSSVPSTFPTGATVLHTHNEIYLTATDGTVVYRRTKVSHTF